MQISANDDETKQAPKIERKLCENGNPRISKRGHAKLIDMDLSVYEKIIQTSYEAKLVNDAMDDLKNGAILFNAKSIFSDIQNDYLQTYSYFLLDKAIYDFKEILKNENKDFYAIKSKTEFTNNVKRALESVSITPKLGFLVDNQYIVNKNLRRLLVDYHKIFYFINEKQKSIVVLRMVYPKVDMGTPLNSKKH